MDNVFYTKPGNITENRLELTDQEARHAAKVLRFNVGDEMFASDGKGNLYRTQIASVTKKSVVAEIKETELEEEPEFKKVLAFGAIKKRDRLEFAVEKAVELGVWEICVFNGDHSERSKINQERLQSVALSAFKQSKRKWLPEIVYKDSLKEVLSYYKDHRIFMAHMTAESEAPRQFDSKKNLLLVGPEGGFSDREAELGRNKSATFLSLGKNRLRAETAVVSILAQFLYTK